MHRQVTYNTEKFSDCFDQDGCRILSFTIRTTDGQDENYAAKRAEAAGSTLTEELIKFSLVSYCRSPKSGDTNELVKIDSKPRWSCLAQARDS
jgi:hypothetical protein